MISISKIIIIILLLMVNSLSAAGFLTVNPDSILIHIRNHEFEKADRKIDKYKLNKSNTKTDRQVLEELQYYNSINKEYGVYVSKPLRKRKYSAPLSEYIKAIQLLNKGFYGLLYELNDDSRAVKTLHQSLNLAQKLENKPLTCEISKAILTYFIRLFNITDNNFQYYNEIYKDNLYDSTESDVQKLLEFFIKIQYENKKFSPQEVQEMKRISEGSIPEFYRLYSKKQLALYYELYPKDYQKANQYYLESLTGIDNYGIDTFFKQTQLSNYGSFLNTWKKHRLAITYLRKIDTIYRGRTYYNNVVYKYANLSSAYAGLKIYDSAYIYREKSRILKNEFEQSKHNAIIDQLNGNEKDQKINYQNKLLMSYENNKILYLTLIGIVFLIASYSFVRWKKVDYRRRKLAKENESLQVEHFQTIQELEKVKQLVIEDHIVLKNKAKIYLNELQYIKAEDHYLNVVTKDGRNHFVRGKLSNVILELPGNFVKCHRSYIINRNFVKQEYSKFLKMSDNSEIPISRDFKL